MARLFRTALACALVLPALALLSPAAASPPVAGEQGRIVQADIVALDHLLVYNRFGSFNPYGMIFALRRDVTAIKDEDSFVPDAAFCGTQSGTASGTVSLAPGMVRLRDCKRPRPLVLRADVGDLLVVNVTNMLRRDQPGISDAKVPPSRKGEKAGPGFCEEPARSGVAFRDEVRRAFDGQCRKAAQDGDEATAPNGFGEDWPLTRNLSFVIPGLEPVAVPDELLAEDERGALDEFLDEGEPRIHPACRGTFAVRPGESFKCAWRLGAEGTHLFSSFAAPAGGQADGGSLMHGLFGALIVEAKGAKAFRSQVTKKAFSKVWEPSAKAGAPRHARAEAINYYASEPDAAETSAAGPFGCGAATVPVLAIHRRCTDAGSRPRYEIVHGDLNAVIVPDSEAAGAVDPKASELTLRDWRVTKEAATAFREFTVIFHDELKTFYADDLKALGRYGQLDGIRDGFAINYGASGVGSTVLANRLRKGPAANCAECLYEEFFLESWANGDPALLEVFPDDPSNVHHSYLNDKVVFRNLHAGKETHVFHLHSHQWFAGNDAGRGAYLDSQTIGPQQGLTYRIYQGGLDRYAAVRNGDAASPAEPKGYWSSLGSGNRNRTPGDAIFHCHLYPHFAQGMWALWRVHDVLEDGTRLLPDGQKNAGLSIESVAPTTLAEVEDPTYRTPRREGSIGLKGEWNSSQEGTPIPGLVPLPEFGLPLLPTYAETGKDAEGEDLAGSPMPGYPFYIAGTPGHRTPQPPLDMADTADAGLSADVAAALDRPRLDGGLPRHVVAAGRALPAAASDADRAAFRAGQNIQVPVARMLALGDLTSIFGRLRLELLPHAGTMLERAAMAFHHDGEGVKMLDAAGRKVARQDPGTGGYPVGAAPALPQEPPLDATTPEPVVAGAAFPVNGAPGAPGAPFADPCGAPSALAGGKPEDRKPYRRFDAHTGSWAKEAATFEARPDPFWSAAEKPMVADPGLIAFRRFRVSAVDVGLVVNRAGWHDPQGRINVLSEGAAGIKGKRTATAEPFYFRAFSGECLEFQHTNETAKALDLDDFQMRVPTDTIGQHIHLVKFDVTSSDGSGNGFNYEDGTFAPAEILERLCAARGLISKREGEDPASIDDPAPRDGDKCEESFIKEVSKLPRLTQENIGYFQTTVQRWFADPILSYESRRNGGSGLELVADRTMRTVFTHDHFGPSNIQQHGFYSALLIEPSTHIVCPLPRPGESTDITGRCVPGPAVTPSAGPPTLSAALQENLVGSRANVFNYKDNALEQHGATPNDQVSGDPLQVDAREYALAIADFALLYDGKRDAKPETPGALARDHPSKAKGLDRLVGEAKDPSFPSASDDDPSPAKDLADAGKGLSKTEERVVELIKRRREVRAEHGRPIAPPERPEAISAAHHDPYLVNYRNEPIPLRVGGDRLGRRPPFAQNPCGALPPRGTSADHRSIVRQRTDETGDMANLFRSGLHGDPCTPVLDALSGDRIVVRLIQGAQEVQHVFTVEGRTIRRNVDQPFPAERHASERDGPQPHSVRCAESPLAQSGRPDEFARWAVGMHDATDGYWPAMDKLVAGCDNALGFIAAQEVGISEHFEMGALFSAFVSENSPRSKVATILDDPRFDDAAMQAGQNPAMQFPTGRPALDLLYHFGSTDAQWNGAWGLIRTYEDQAAPDLSACLIKPTDPAGFEACVNPDPGTPQIGERLASFEALRAGWNNRTARSAKPAQAAISDDASELRAWCPEGAPRIPVIAAAVRAGDVLPKSKFAFPGTVYAAGPDRRALFDPDGLMLVPLALSDLGLDHDDTRKFYSRAENTGSLVELFDPPVGATLVSRRLDGTTLASFDSDDIRRIVRTKLGATGATDAQQRGQPFVLRVEAGDCIDFLLVNAISATTAARDWPGDALMPRIVPLNTDRYQTRGRSAAEFELVPSRSVALSVPLPVGMLKPGGLLPAGVNDAAAVPPGDGSAPFWSVTRYYAGFSWTSATNLAELMQGMSAPRSLALLSGKQETGDDTLLERLKGAGVEPTLPYVPSGKPYCSIDEQLVVFGLVVCAKDRTGNGLFAAQKALDTFFAVPKNAAMITRSIPYAFGTLPIRSMGDVVSHGAHGLTGTLIVEPRYRVPGKKEDHPMDASRFAWRHSANELIKAPDVHAGVFANEIRDKTEVPKATIRESVLLFQDGLNLWRRAPTVPDFFGWHGRPMPDCIACGDSYDWGEHGVSYRSTPFRLRIAGFGGADAGFGTRGYPSRGDKDDLNAVEFPQDFLSRRFKPRHMSGVETPPIAAGPGEEIAVRIALPQGRARQRSFVASGFGYDDLFPGFGSGHSALLGPGKAVTAFGCAPEAPGDTIWRDGPQHIFAAGVWGHLTVAEIMSGDPATKCDP